MGAEEGKNIEQHCSDKEEIFQLKDEIFQLRVNDAGEPRFDSEDHFSSSPIWSERIRTLLARVGASDIPVLLRGETGVGKEVIARQLHASSKRADGPFIKVNCAALPSELVESELFGYERGAFTGAFRSTPGRFEMANRGTILLDEIGDMDLKLQAKLLQVLQDQEFQRLGSNSTTRVDVRIMAASHCDFELAISEKRFREDLFYRINVVDFRIPPLRQRRNEILPLCDLFLDRHATPEFPKLEIPPILRQVLLEYTWPGNVRELENLMRKYLVLRSPGVLAGEIRQRIVASRVVSVPPEMSDFQEFATNGERTSRNFIRDISFSDLTFVQDSGRPQLVHRAGDESEAVSQSALLKLDKVRKAAEAEAILNALHTTRWNRKRAAYLLNIDYKALLYKMKKLNLSQENLASVG